MLLIHQLDSVLGQTSKIRMLRFLVSTEAECNGREIAAAVGLSHVKCHTALQELNRHGIVEMRRSGQSILYRLHLKNVLVEKMLIPLFEREARLQNILGETIARYLKKPAPKSAILFGSFASGNARPDSDIDVLVIVSQKKDIPLFKKRLEEAEIHITTGFGNHLSPIVMEEQEFRRKFRQKDKLIQNIVKKGKVLFGESVNDLIARDD